MPIDDRRVTLKDIAEKTGFTVNTVSQALRGSPKLREETKAAIRAAAKELGYVHNALAGSLRSAAAGPSPSSSAIRPTCAFPSSCTHSSSRSARSATRSSS